MASTQSVIDIIFNGIDNASGAIGTVSDGLGTLDAQVQGIAVPFANLADGLLKAEAAALAFGAAVGILAVRETVQFQDSLYLVEKQLAGSNITIDEARVKIEELGLQYGINANEIAASMAGFLAGGNDFKNSAILVETALQFMIAGEISAIKATDTLTASLSGWRVPTAEAAAGAQKVGDILNKLADISQSRLLEPIADAFTRVAPAAYTAGLTMEETGAIVARLVDVFQSGEIAGTALSSGLSALSDPTEEATEKIESLGVSVRDQSGELRLSGDILKDLAEKWGTFSAAQQAEAAAIIFGKEQADKFKVVLGDWARIQEYLTKTLDETTGAVGSLAREVEGKLKLISASIDSANESWRQFLENLGARITTGDALQALITDFGTLGIAFKDVVNQGGFDPLIELLQSQFGDIGDLIEAIAKNLPKAFEGLDFSGLVTSLEDLQGEVGAVFRAFFGDIDLTTVEGLRTALQRTIDTFTALTVTVTGIIETGVKPLFEFLGQGVTKFGELDKASQLDFGQFLGNMKLIVDAGTLVAGALIGIGAAGRDMSGTMDQAFGAMKIAANAVQIVFDELYKKFLQITMLVDEGNLFLAETTGDTAGIEKYTARIEESRKAIEEINKALERNRSELEQGVDQYNKGTAAVEKLTAQQNAYAAAAGQPIPVTEIDGVISKLAQFEADMARQKAGYDNYFDFLKDIPADSVERVRSQMGDLEGATKTAGESIANLSKEISAIPQDNLIIKGDIEFNDEPIKNLKKTWDEQGNPVFEAIENQTVKATGAFAAVSDKTQDAKDTLDQLTQSGKLSVDQLLELTKTTNDFKVAMEEIASNERLKNIEFAVNLKTAQLETDMERVKAAFASIDTTIQSTGDLLGSLFGNLIDTDSRWKELEIQEQIDAENRRRQEALDLQRELTEAEIARIEAQTEALNRGDALITITGDGLEAELEAFMWKILGKIRMRANAEFADYLLGLGVTA